jgi:dihydroorotate dehydrogenase (NAD+) catalytic subunit
MLKHDLDLQTPLLNAAGSLGFSPDVNGPIALNELGAFITNPISLSPRTPAKGTRLIEFPGGILLHTGHPSPGFKTIARRYADRWARSQIPVITHLLVNQPHQVANMVPRLEELENLTGVELGLPGEIDRGMAVDLIQAGLGELPIIARVPLERALEVGQLAVEAGAVAVSLGPPRGALPGPDGILVQGRLYGPSLFPGSLEAVRTLVTEGLPVIGAGGVYHRSQVEVMLEVGAMAVQLDTVLWRGKWGKEK